MPLRNLTIQSELLSQSGLIELVRILESKDLLPLRHTNNITVSRLINVYPATPQLNRPGLIRRIMDHYWVDPYKSILVKIEKFDHFLLALGKREHFIHQFEVMLLGLHFLEIIKDVKDLNKILKLNDWSEILYTWTVASIGHDFGYPYEVSSELIGKLSSLYEQINMDKLAEHISIIKEQPGVLRENQLLNFIKETAEPKIFKSLFDIKTFIGEWIKYDLSIDQGAFNKIEKMLIFGEETNGQYPLTHKPDHGYISSLMLCRSVLEDFFSKPDAPPLNDFENCPEYKILRWAASAICVHNFSDPEYKLIKFDKNPLAFILFIFDNIHDWNRKVFDNEPKWPNYSITEFEKKEKIITLELYVWDDYWTDDMIDRVNSSLAKKREMLENLPGKPNPSLGVSVNIKYKFSTAKIPEAFKISIIL